MRVVGLMPTLAEPMGCFPVVVWIDQGVLADSTKAIPVALPALDVDSHAAGYTSNSIEQAVRSRALRNCKDEATDPSTREPTPQRDHSLPQEQSVHLGIHQL